MVVSSSASKRCRLALLNSIASSSISFFSIGDLRHHVLCHPRQDPSEGGSNSARLRFPGWSHDAETDVYENWHRYYDPFNGRYLSPEPLLQNPRSVALASSLGLQMGPYAYAGNNPVRYGDADGRSFWGPACVAYASAMASLELSGRKEIWGKGGDKIIHCVASCQIALQCGTGTGFALGYLKELDDKHNWSGRGSMYEKDDLKANEAGERCAMPQSQFGWLPGLTPTGSCYNKGCGSDPEHRLS
jgi:RHS repeat-associated protein